MDQTQKDFTTRCVHAASHLGKEDSKALVPPIQLSTSYVFDSVEDGRNKCLNDELGYVYGRVLNPTTDLFEQQLAALEGAGAALAFSSGVAAISGTLLMVLKAGDHCIVDGTIYSATHNMFQLILPKFGVEVDFTDTGDLEAVAGLVRKNTRLIYCETPANPTLKVIDLPALAAFARERKLMTIVDSTFATPYIQNPLAMGIDVVIHSTTKYICGHGDAIGARCCPPRSLLISCG